MTYDEVKGCSVVAMLMMMVMMMTTVGGVGGGEVAVMLCVEIFDVEDDCPDEDAGYTG